MTRRVYGVVDEPCGNSLRDLLLALIPFSYSASMVIRDDLPASAGAYDVIARLRPYMLSEYKASEWPGTKLLDGVATVFRFRLDEVIVDELIRTSHELYGWQQPALPEDLALLRIDGTVVLASIAHERDCYVVLDDQEYVRLDAAAPEVARLLQFEAFEA